MSPPRPLFPKDSGRFFVTVTLDFSHAAVTGQGFIALAALRVRKMELDRIRSVLRLRSKLSTASGPRFPSLKKYQASDADFALRLTIPALA
ncbi:hypothetical protein [Bacillus paralicheniformis]|uniref:hypothetical protein n=1 Tax=Bacillus paralicheniformis TaxID=1648923 RepID=UPI002F94CCC2